MKLAVTRDALAVALQRVLPVVAAKHSLPVVTHILLEAKRGKLRVYGTDLEQAVGVPVEADVEEDGAITLPAKLLTGAVKALGSGMVRLRVADQEAIVECGRARLNLKGLPGSEFPAFPSVPFSQGWEVSAEDLTLMASRVSYATSREESRPILNGVLWELTKKHLRMVATSGYQMALATLRTAGPGEANLIIPPAALRRVAALFGGEETVEVAFTENMLGFRSKGSQFVTRLIDGPYPNYDIVIAKDYKHAIECDREELLDALHRVELVAGEKFLVAMTFNEKSIGLEAVTSDLGEARDRVTATLTGEEMRLGLNIAFLKQALEAMPTERVKIAFKDPKRAVHFSPVGSPKGTPEYFALLMPINLDVASAGGKEKAA